MAKLEEWSIISDERNPFLAPELRKKRLNGIVYDREGFDNGTAITTSSIQSLDLKNKIATTRNTVYELGYPSKEYIEWLNSNGKKIEDYVV